VLLEVILMIAKIIFSIKQAKPVIARALIIVMDTASVRIANAFVSQAGLIMIAQLVNFIFKFCFLF